MTNKRENSTRRKRTDWWMYSIPVIFMIAACSYIAVQLRPGNWGIVLFYLAPALVGLLSVLFLITGIVHAAIRRPFLNSRRIVAFAALILLCCSGLLYSKYPSSYDQYKSVVRFRLPLDTTLTVAWGGGAEDQNYHVAYPDQCWAYDMMVVLNGSSYSGDSSKLENYFAYGLPVLAPAAGKIVSVTDSFPDMPVGVLGGGGYANPGGNQVIIEVAHGEYLVLCHLKPGSILVHPGDTVLQGQQLASLGNSGNTSEPHIHIHLQNSTDDFLAEGIPLYFHDYVSNGKFVSEGIPTGGVGEDGNWGGETVQHAGTR